MDQKASQLQIPLPPLPTQHTTPEGFYLKMKSWHSSQNFKPPPDFKFPVISGRKFYVNWRTGAPSLLYSIKNDAAFCKSRLCFRSNTSTQRPGAKWITHCFNWLQKLEESHQSKIELPWSTYEEWRSPAGRRKGGERFENPWTWQKLRFLSTKAAIWTAAASKERSFVSYWHCDLLGTKRDNIQRALRKLCTSRRELSFFL